MPDLSDFEAGDALEEISRKFANVSLEAAYHRGETVERSQLPTLQRLLWSNDIDASYHAILMIRRYLSQDNNESRITDILSLNILERVKTLLEASSAPQLQYESAWVITNIAAGNSTQTMAVVDADYIKVLMDCLCSNGTIDFKAQISWALSNIAGESAPLRERLLHQNAMNAVIEVLKAIYEQIVQVSSSENTTDLTKVIREKGAHADVRVLTWTISNMCRGGFKTKELWQLYIPAFEILSEMTLLDDPEICTDACWGLSRILSNMHKVDPFLRALHIHRRLCPRLVKLLDSDNVLLQTPVLRTVINIASGPNEHISCLLKGRPLEVLLRYLSPSVLSHFRRDALLTIANIAAGSEDHVRQVLETPGIMEMVETYTRIPDTDAEILPYTSNKKYTHQDIEEEWKITQEAVWIICNVTSLGNIESICNMLDAYPQIPKRLSRILLYQSTPMPTTLKVLDAMINILSRTSELFNVNPPLSSPPKNPYYDEFVQLGITRRIQSMKAEYPGVNSLQERLDLYITAANNCNSQHLSNTLVSGSAEAFGLPTRKVLTTGANVRRVVRGTEDGDVRWVEDAVGKLCILESS
ncbi:armadillo-type protein [Umbelopsis sp. PMI_123]|nr:armadillo-type protein [Umbelopsis sp. PMI_123]